MPPDPLVSFLRDRLAEDEASLRSLPAAGCGCAVGEGGPHDRLQDVLDEQQAVQLYLGLPSSTPDEVVAREQVRLLLEEIAHQYAAHGDHRADWAS